MTDSLQEFVNRTDECNWERLLRERDKLRAALEIMIPFIKKLKLLDEEQKRRFNEDTYKGSVECWLWARELWQIEDALFHPNDGANP